MTLGGYSVKSTHTEQWIGSEWAVWKDGKVVHEIGAEEGKTFGRERCWLWVLGQILGGHR